MRTFNSDIILNATFLSSMLHQFISEGISSVDLME